MRKLVKTKVMLQAAGRPPTRPACKRRRPEETDRRTEEPCEDGSTAPAPWQHVADRLRRALHVPQCSYAEAIAFQSKSRLYGFLSPFDLPDSVQSLLREAASEVHRLPWFVTAQPYLLDVAVARGMTAAALWDFRLKHGLALAVEDVRKQVHSDGNVVDTLVKWAVSGLAPGSVWHNTQFSSFDYGSRADMAMLPVLLDRPTTQSIDWQRAKLVFLDCDGVCVKRDESLPELPVHLPDEQLAKVLTMPRYSSRALPKYRDYHRPTLQLLQDWQERDPDIYFVMATAHLGMFDPACFRDVMMYPLRVIGGISKRNWRGIVEWVEQIVWGGTASEPRQPARFVVLDDDSSYFEFASFLRGGDNRQQPAACFRDDALPVPFVAVKGGLLSPAEVARASQLLDIEWWPDDLMSEKMWGPPSPRMSGGVLAQAGRQQDKDRQEPPAAPWLPFAEDVVRVLSEPEIVSFADAMSWGRQGRTQEPPTKWLPAPVMALLRDTAARVQGLPWFASAQPELLDAARARGELADRQKLREFRRQHGLALARESSLGAATLRALGSDVGEDVGLALSGVPTRHVPYEFHSSPLGSERSCYVVSSLCCSGACDTLEHDLLPAQSAKFIFLRDSAVIQEFKKQGPDVPLHLPDEQLVKVLTTPRFSDGTLALHRYFDQEAIRLLQGWQEEDPDIHFVVASRLLECFDAQCFREVFLYPLRIVGGVAKPDMGSIVDWMQRFAWAPKGAAPMGARFLVLDGRIADSEGAHPALPGLSPVVKVAKDSDWLPAARQVLEWPGWRDIESGTL